MTPEERLDELEEWRASLESQQFNFPLDKVSQQIVNESIKREFINRIFPVVTDDGNEGTAELVDFNPTIQMVDAASKTVTFFYIIPFDSYIKAIELIWTEPTGSGNIRGITDISAGTKGEAVAIRTTGGTAFVDATTGADVFNYTRLDGVGGVDVGGFRGGDMLGIHFTRTAAHADDTINDQVNIYGLKITLFG